MSTLLRSSALAARVALRYLPGLNAPAHPDRLIATHGRSFHLASRFLPDRERTAVVILYGFFRTLDDLVDEAVNGADPVRCRAELESWRAWLSGSLSAPAPDSTLGIDLATVIRQYEIPRRYFLEMIDGLCSDLDPRDPANFAELRLYCYRVASTVGLAMAHMMGATDRASLMAAADLGLAMQLTNILRDVGEDLAKGRLYLPLDELERFGSSRGHLVGLLQGGAGPDERFVKMMRFQITRTRAYYSRGMAGIWLLPADCRLPILVASRLYRQILREIERNAYDTLNRRAVVPRSQKANETAIAFMLDLLWRRNERTPAV